MVQTWVRRIRRGDVKTRKLPGAAVAAGRPGKVSIAVAGTAALRPWNLPAGGVTVDFSQEECTRTDWMLQNCSSLVSVAENSLFAPPCSSSGFLDELLWKQALYSLFLKEKLKEEEQ